MIAAVREKIDAALGRSGLDGFVLAGADNIAYAAGVLLPFAHQYPDRPAFFVKSGNGEAGLVCPPDWAVAVRDQGFEGPVETYDANEERAPLAAARVLGRLLDSLHLAKGMLGLDLEQVTAEGFAELRRAAANMRWQPADALLRELRMVKTTEELERLEAAAIQADQGIIGALHHLEGTVGGPEYTMVELAERMRVHVIEWGGSGVGHVGVAQGPEAAHYYVPPQGLVQAGILARLDMTNHHLGYWAKAGRMIVTGEPRAEQTAAYAANQALKRAALAALRSRARAHEVFDAVARAAEEGSIPFVAEFGAGHGLGCSEAEQPFLTPDDNTELAPGMALALDVYTRGPQGELMHSVDSYALTEGEPRLLSWYRRWDRLYSVVGIKSTH